MTTPTLRRIVATATATASLTLAAAGPALAQGEFSGTMNRWFNGDKTKNWQDKNSDSTKTSATVARGCTQEFTGRIMRVRGGFRPDTVVAKERINCRSYADAVRAGDVAAATYHFSITGLPTVCHSRKCTVFPTSGRYRVRY